MCHHASSSSIDARARARCASSGTSASGRARGLAFGSRAPAAKRPVAWICARSPERSSRSAAARSGGISPNRNSAANHAFCAPPCPACAASNRKRYARIAGSESGTSHAAANRERFTGSGAGAPEASTPA